MHESLDSLGIVTSPSPSSRLGAYPASRQAVLGCRPSAAAGKGRGKSVWIPCTCFEETEQEIFWRGVYVGRPVW